MARIKYVAKTFKPDTMRVIEQANTICAQYARHGLTLTLRQLYYQFVARGLLNNEQREYKRLGDILNDARMAGQMDWDYLVDRTRNLVALPHWDNPVDIVEAGARSYRTDRWAQQPCRMEVWIEKDAGIGVIEGVCHRNDVPYFSCRGYTSVSEIWAGAQRIRRHLEAGQDVVVLHIGDHDPSGLDMSRDVEERLRVFIDGDHDRATSSQLIEELTAEVGRREVLATWQAMDPIEQSRRFRAARRALGADGWGEVSVRRIALNLDQVRMYDPPPNPAKSSDARYRRYVQETGLDESWELDALDPLVLQDLIQDAIDEHRDADSWAASTERMEADRGLLTETAERWDEVMALLATDGQDERP
ncbi:hypothetical protein [Micromonospora sp. NPDC049662]|uniref:hypothetical protein n=1 Tax=Micromonospora sp. NPDC049662 TaxID=3155397 RepID=UPI00343900AB